LDGIKNSGKSPGYLTETGKVSCIFTPQSLWRFAKDKAAKTSLKSEKFFLNLLKSRGKYKMARKEKEIFVKDFQDKVQSTGAVVLTEYQGLTVVELNELRAKLRPLNCEYTIIKNSLGKIALKNAGMEDFAKHFEGPIAVALEKGDPITTAKVLVDFAKEHKKLKIKVALFEKKIILDKDIKALAALPSKEVLLSQLLRTMNAPITNLVGVLSANVKKLVYVLDAIKNKAESKK
jgi:large subunit ribosomal protein L10